VLAETEPDADVGKIKKRMIPATRAGCIGPAREVVTQLRRLEDLGVELVLCKLIPTAENVGRIGEEVIAPLQRLHRAMAHA